MEHHVVGAGSTGLRGRRLRTHGLAFFIIMLAVQAATPSPGFAAFPWTRDKNSSSTAAEAHETQHSAPAPREETLAPIPMAGPINSAQLGSAVILRIGHTSGSLSQAMADIQRWQIPNVIVEAVTSGTAIFPSKILPRISNAYGIEGDALTEICAEAAKRNLRVFASFSVLRWAAPAQETATTTHPLIAAHPGWLDLTSTRTAAALGDAVYLSPSIPEVKKTLLAVTDELCAYPIAGICFTDVNYMPHLQSGYHPVMVQKYNELSGHDPLLQASENPEWTKWTKFREDNLTSLALDLAARMRENSREYGRRIVSGIAVLPGCFLNPREDPAGQNWSPWIRKNRFDLALPVCAAANLQELEKQIREMRGVFQGVPVACLPMLILNEPGLLPLHSPLESQHRVLESAGFRHCAIVDYEAYRHEQEPPSPDYDQPNTPPEEKLSPSNASTPEKQRSPWKPWWS